MVVQTENWWFKGVNSEAVIDEYSTALKMVIVVEEYLIRCLQRSGDDN